MIKVTGPAQVSGAQRSKKTGSTGSTEFSSLLEGLDETEEAKPAKSVTSIASVNIIQEVNPEGHKKRALVEKGNEMLDKLEEIRDSLLFGNISISRLQNLKRIIDGVENNNTDPELDGIIEEIKTRAAVELAKLGF